MADVVRENLIRIRQEGAAETAAAYDRVRGASDAYGASVERAGGSADKAVVPNRRLNETMINVSRVVQDLPYGLRGIMNNIDPLLLSLRSLNAEAAATGVPLTGLLGKAAGFASTLNPLLVSAVGAAVLIGPSLLSFFDSSSKKAEENAGKMRDLNKEWHDFLLQSSRITDQAKEGILGGDVAKNEEKMKVLSREINQLTAKRDEAAKNVLAIQFEFQKQINEKGQEYNAIYLDTQKITEDVIKKRKEARDAAVKDNEDYWKSWSDGMDAAEAKAEGYAARERGRALARKMSDPYERKKLAFGEPTDEEGGLIPALEKEKQRLELRVRQARTEKEIRDLLDEERDVQVKLDSLTGSQFQVVTQLSTTFGNLRSGMQGLGLETDSWLGKLISALQTLQAIKEVLDSLKVLQLLFGGLGITPSGLGVGEGGIDLPTGNPVPVGPGKGGGGIMIPVIQAIDSKSFRDYLKKPENRRALADALNEAARLS